MWSGIHCGAAGAPARNTPAAEKQGKFPARVFANPALEQPGGVEARDDAGVVLVLATATDDPIAQLPRRGGHRGGPVDRDGTGPGQLPADRAPRKLVESRAEVRTKLLGGDGFPQMLLRVGWAALNAEPLPATPRRPLSDVVVRLDEPVAHDPRLAGREPCSGSTAGSPSPGPR